MRNIVARTDNCNILGSLECGLLKSKQTTYKEKTYNIIRYNKESEHTMSLFKTIGNNSIGHYRSVIFSSGEVVCFAPPKSVDYDQFKQQIPLTDIISVEEYVEGTMINLFWDGDKWEIATRSSVGGEVSFYSDETSEETMTFRTMFLHTIIENEFNTQTTDFFHSLNEIPKTYCLSFVLQHPKNRIVSFIDFPKLYLVKVFDLSEKGIINDVNLRVVSDILPSWVNTPKHLDSSMEELEKIMGGGMKDYSVVGAMIYGIDRNSGLIVRTKIRNESYEKVRLLRGNQPKLKYRYLMIRNDETIKQYLKYYPEHISQFDIYEKQIRTFTGLLFSLYIECYIKKLAPLKAYSAKFRTHMFHLHDIYKSQLRPQNHVMRKKNVIEYVNNLHPSLLMHSINQF